MVSFRWFRWFRSGVSMVSAVPVVPVFSFRWFRFGVSGFSNPRTYTFNLSNHNNNMLIDMLLF